MFSSYSKTPTQLLERLCRWNYYINKSGMNKDVLSVSKSFHPNIKFTYETEYNSRLPVFMLFYVDMGKILLQQCTEKRQIMAKNI